MQDPGLVDPPRSLQDLSSRPVCNVICWNLVLDRDHIWFDFDRGQKLTTFVIRFCCKTTVLDWVLEGTPNFGLRIKFGLRNQLSLRPQFSMTLYFSLIRSYTGLEYKILSLTYKVLTTILTFTILPLFNRIETFAPHLWSHSLVHLHHHFYE